MPDAKLLLLARELRTRAQEVLAQADTFQDAGAREKMRRIAASYERLAQRLENHAGDIDEVRHAASVRSQRLEAPDDYGIAWLTATCGPAKSRGTPDDRRRVDGQPVGLHKPDRAEAKMAKEKPLDLAVVRAWLDAWEENALFSDAAVRHLQSLIPDNDCIVVITRGVGRPPRSLAFRRWRRVEVLSPTPTTPGGRVPAASLDPDQMAMFDGPNPPPAPTVGQFWLQVDVTPRQKISAWAAQRIFRWDGTRWVLYGHLRDEAMISMQGKKECHFAEALAWAHDLAKWSCCQIIYTFDDSTRGTA